MRKAIRRTWYKPGPEALEKRIRSLAAPQYIKAHVACIVWLDLSMHDNSLAEWCIDLRNAYNPTVKEDLTRLEKALVDIGWPQAQAHERAFRDVCTGKAPTTERRVDPDFLLPGAARKHGKPAPAPSVAEEPHADCGPLGPAALDPPPPPSSGGGRTPPTQ